MDRKKLLAQVPDGIRPRLPKGLQGFETIAMGRLLKVYYGDPAFHFEVWFHENKGMVEVAYHAEGPASANGRLLERLEARLVDIKKGLGPTAELEPWVRSWVRLYRMLSLDYPDEKLQGQLVDALAKMIIVVQPLVADLAPVEV